MQSVQLKQRVDSTNISYFAFSGTWTLSTVKHISLPEVYSTGCSLLVVVLSEAKFFPGLGKFIENA